METPIPTILDLGGAPAEAECAQLGQTSNFAAVVGGVRNRRRLLTPGRSLPRTKDPRLEVARLPDVALDQLVQRHPDRDVIDLLRAERERLASALG